MNLCVKALLSVIYLVGLYHCIPLTGGLECPQCMHVGFKLSNMPFFSSIVDQMLGPILAQYSNPSCEGNTAPAEMCPISSGNDTRVCESFTFKLSGVGMTAAYLPAAGMELSVVSRGCGIHNGVETPKCRPILDLVGAGQNVAILSQLSQYSAMFQNVTYNGQWCQSANVSVMP